MFGSQRSLNLNRQPSSLLGRVSSSAAYFNVSSSDTVTVTIGNPVTARSPHMAGNPPAAYRNSDPVGGSAATYYNIRKLTPRISRSGGQSSRPTASSQGLSSPRQNASTNPPVPRRSKPPPIPSCPPANVTQSSKDSANHSYYVFPSPSTTAEVNHVPAGRKTRSGTIPRSESLNDVGFSSPSRKAKSPPSGNHNTRNGAGRLWRHYSVGDLLYKLQAVVSSGFSIPRGLVRSMSRFSMSHSAANPSSPTKVSPDRSTADNGFFSPGLKQRSASEILHRSPQPEDAAQRKSPSPEKEIPPVPPPRLVVRQKPAAKMMKVLTGNNVDFVMFYCQQIALEFRPGVSNIWPAGHNLARQAFLSGPRGLPEMSKMIDLCLIRCVFSSSKICQNSFSAGACPGALWGSL